MASIETAYGIITKANSDFGYGFVTIEDGAITYRDSMVWKTWKTVKGFENWVKKQNAINGGVFDRIATREYKPTHTVLSW